ncbi:MAG TPA: 30S ribosomal protein S6 [Ignavibacteriaceae bacterium]|nr:30S ribosomal protein S6 [Ignavibacteriaceae bacterium]
MKKNVYDSTVLINAALDDSQIESTINRIKDFIASNNGELRELENWGRKRLAYMVNKSKIGYYAVFRFDAPSNLISKLDRLYTLDEQIFRFLTIKLSKEALEHIEKNKAQSVAAEEEITPNSVVETTEEDINIKKEDNDNN